VQRWRAVSWRRLNCTTDRGPIWYRPPIRCGLRLHFICAPLPVRAFAVLDMRACSPAAIARQSPRVSARRRLHAAMAAVGPTSSLLGGPEAVRDSTVLVVGGGMSGLGAAATLVSAGVSTLLVEQGRGVGGRVCSRRARGPHGELSFDFGCQYFAPKAGDPFAAVLAELETSGVVARWGAGGRLGTVSCDASGHLDWSSFAPQPPSKAAFVGVPTASVVGRHLLAAAVARPGAGTLAVATGTRAAPGSLRREGDSWLVSTHPKPEPGKTTITHHRVVIAAASASSTFNVISPVAPKLAAAASAVRADACWGLLVAFATPLFGDAGCVADGVLVSGSSSLAWVARNSSKPGRQSCSGADCWVVHATPTWSNERRELEAAVVAQALLQEFCQACGLSSDPPTLHVEAFLWNAAFPLNPASPAEGCYADTSLRLAMAGDWCIGPRAGDAWASGVAAANAVLRDML